MVKIIKLSKNYLEQTCNLADAVFNYEDPNPGIALRAFLAPKKQKEKFKSKYDCIDFEYYIAIDPDQNIVVGTCGIYSLGKDHKDTDWLGWYCVDPKYRRRGIGKSLLQHCISLTKKRGKKQLKLFTSNHPAEAAAQKIYDSFGFVDDGIKKRSGPHVEVFKKLEL